MDGREGLVSVVTPVYNGQDYLAAMLDSVLAQTWNDLEMILVDDGSQDGTLSIAEQYREKFLARGFDYRILTGPHHSASAAINRGLPWVRGEFLIWPDSDDILEPESVEKRVEFLRAHAGYQCVRSQMRYLDEGGGPAPRGERLGPPDCERLFFPILEGQTFLCCGCYMLRTAALLRFYPLCRIPEYEVGQNFQMLLPVLYHYPCHTIAEALYTVRVRPDSHSRRARTRQEEEQRYAAFEALVDELAGICGITAPDHLRRIRLWKLRRRYALARKYGQRARCAAAWMEIRWIEVRSGRLKRRLGKLLENWKKGKEQTSEESRSP